MKNITTITLTAGVEACAEVGGGNCIIKNRTGAALYASAKSGVTPDADGVIYIADGESDVLDVNGDGVYLYSANGGKVQCVGTDNAAQNFNKAVGGSGSLTADGTTISSNAGVISANYSGTNLLDNPDFTINQRGASGTVSTTGYFVDRWNLVSGTVTINANKTLTLNGTIKQVLETAAGTAVTASSSAGTAVYDNSTKTFTITGSNAALSWAKLETGAAATQFNSPNCSLELMKCQRYFQRISNALTTSALYIGFAIANDSTQINFPLPLAQTMRVPPTIMPSSADCIKYTTSTIANAQACTAITKNGAIANKYLTLRITGAVSVGVPYAITLDANSYIDFSADM